MKTFDNATEVAALIRGSRLVPLDSRNHILLASEPAWRQFVAEVRDFLEPERIAWAASKALTGRETGPREALSPRELEALRLAARGLANDAIAKDMGLSPRTVERHLSNAYSKLGLVGKAARAAAVAEVVRQGLA
jgi:DNA-binding NarL/FixJ family response regulator